jgi:hypothetical protein
MAGWRKALLRTGRESDLYHCQLCKHRLWVKQRRLWAALLHYRGKSIAKKKKKKSNYQCILYTLLLVFRVIAAASFLGLILIPAGNINYLWAVVVVAY